ncbi:hypothetical protein JVU11DRAFT_4733 [Chiua virens]|nr:hypothetical protein JVU11DRAFT_4733 [Chiua virens]
MSSFNYAAPPQSPTFGIFPSAPCAPHAFSSVHGNPRDSHAMYASLSPSMGFKSGNPQSNKSGSINPLKKLFRK